MSKSLDLDALRIAVIALNDTKRGRPPLPPGVGRTVRIEWRTTPERKLLAQRAADACGMTLSAWIENLVRWKT